MTTYHLIDKAEVGPTLAEARPDTSCEVVQPSYGRRGEFRRFERKHRTEWAVIMWRGAQFTCQEYPSAVHVRIEPAETAETGGTGGTS